MTGPGRAYARAAGLGRRIDWWLDGPILNPLRRILAALIVAAGPWLIAVAALVFVSRALSATLDAYRLEDLRLTVVYAFMLAPLTAAPLGVIAARVVLTGDGEGPATGALIVTACGLSGLSASVLAGLIALVLGLKGAPLVLGFLLLTSASAMMWTIFPVLAALRARRRLILSFGTGMGLAVLLTALIAARADTGLEILWCFILGTGLSLLLSALPYRAGATDPQALTDALTALRAAAAKAWPLAIGAVCAILGTWADKWVYWIGPDHLTSSAGFWHFPPYDSVMFFAHLSALPALAALAAFQEGPVSDTMRRFRDGITGGDTLPGLNRRAEALRSLIWDGLVRIFGAQIVFSAGLVLMAAAVANAAGLRLDQFLLLRVGLLAAVLHALFLAASAVIALTNSRATFAGLQLLFLGLNIAASSAVAARLGVSALGLTFAAACATAIALPLAARALNRLVRLTFLDENESLF